MFALFLLGLVTCIFQFETKLTASDASAADQFGYSVAISGVFAVAGSPFRATGGTRRGAAYVYSQNFSGPDSWGEVAIITAYDATDYDYFGQGVAISGATLVVGAPQTLRTGVSGAAYVYENGGVATNWPFVKRLSPIGANADDDFGSTLAIDGDYIVGGTAPRSSNTGSASLFARNQGGSENWGAVKELVASDAATGKLFGYDVDVDGSFVLVGAYGDASLRGAAYIFERNTGGADNWGQLKKLTAVDGAADDEFGKSVAISNGVAIVGAPGDDDDGARSGSAYLFYQNLGGANNWGPINKLKASDAAATDNFGTYVAIDGDYASVGTPSNDDAGASSGSVYIFYRNQGGAEMWGEVSKLTTPDATSYDYFGFEVALSGDNAIFGAYGNDDAGITSGSAYIYKNDGTAPNTTTGGTTTGGSSSTGTNPSASTSSASCLEGIFA